MSLYLMNKNGDIFNVSEVFMVQRHKLLDATRGKANIAVNELRDYATPSNVIVYKAVRLDNGDFARDANGNAIPSELVGTGQGLTEIDPSGYFGNTTWQSRSRGGVRHRENELRKRNGGNDGTK